MDHNEFNKKCRVMAELKIKKKEISAAEKKNNEAITDLTRDLHEAYEELNMAGAIGIKDLGKKLVFKQQYRAGVKDSEKYLEWLDANGFGDIAVRKTDWQALDKFCKDRLENGDSLPEGVDGVFKPQIALTAL